MENLTLNNFQFTFKESSLNVSYDDTHFFYDKVKSFSVKKMKYLEKSITQLTLTYGIISFVMGWIVFLLMYPKIALVLFLATAICFLGFFLDIITTAIGNNNEYVAFVTNLLGYDIVEIIINDNFFIIPIANDSDDNDKIEVIKQKLNGYANNI